MKLSKGKETVVLTNEAHISAFKSAGWTEVEDKKAAKAKEQKDDSEGNKSVH